jgi:hypothetical protein
VTGQLGACTSSAVDPAWFDADSDDASHEQARRVCVGCPIRSSCLQDGMAGRHSGVYGGHLLELGRLPTAFREAARGWSDRTVGAYHAAFVGGDESPLTRAGEAEYQRRSKAARRRAARHGAAKQSEEAAA